MLIVSPLRKPGCSRALIFGTKWPFRNVVIHHRCAALCVRLAKILRRCDIDLSVQKLHCGGFQALLSQ
jgi:hypothetical protein